MGFFKKKKKLLIIGLDGVPYEMITGFADSGVMPNLGKVFRKIPPVKMEVTIPEISSISWTSFMTGTDSGEHGIFGFVDLVKGTYKYRFPDFRDNKAVPFFDELGEKGKRSVIINLPSTFPARKIPGVLISGFVALDLKRAVYPRSYLEILEKEGYEVDVDTSKGKNKKKEFLSDLHYTLRTRKNIADMLWKNEKWDIFMFTVTGTDRIHHFMFDSYVDKEHEYHNDFLDYYREVDKIIGDFLQKIEGKDEIELMLSSDHGFGLLKNEIYLNQILKKNGLFDLEKSEKISLTSISNNSKAFAVDPSRIFINLKKKFPNGSVEKKDYEKIRSEIKNLFENYKINGDKVIKKVFYKEELYSSKYLDMAADIILLSNPGYDLKAGLRQDKEFGKNHFTGMHLQNNAFFYSSIPEEIPENMHITDVKRQIFSALKVKTG